MVSGLHGDDPAFVVLGVGGELERPEWMQEDDVGPLVCDAKEVDRPCCGGSDRVGAEDCGS